MNRILDEMDGKQARRTGNGSGMGLLFDHGCDCFSVGVQLLINFYIWGLGQTHLSVLCLVASYGAFYCATLEEYYRGTLVLSKGDAPTDGAFAIIILTFVLGFTGTDFTSKVINKEPFLGVEEITVAQIFGLLVFVFSIVTCIIK